MSLAEVIIVGLAAARLYQLLAHDTITLRFRDWVEQTFSPAFYWLSCPWCAGFWLTLATFGVWFTPVRWLVYLGAAAQVASVTALAVGKLVKDPVEVELTNQLPDLGMGPDDVAPSPMAFKPIPPEHWSRPRWE